MIATAQFMAYFATGIFVLGIVTENGILHACDSSDRELAKQILADDSLTEVLELARALIRTGFSAGDGYGEVWVRDLATFMELACEVQDADDLPPSTEPTF